ncbi:hypothetical protein CUS12_11725 [Enterococcus faecalis]|uniref:DUF4393 domain-containing protein n=1 Tax=Enterococcus faecalis TaxID=1351 RepID=UPI000CF35BAD|nr:DUF4393 domain-containing protein [Enterococcus faecalis]PQG37232.1 hypothetical protein CUS12_11725 [Enterococcus faecalis]
MSDKKEALINIELIPKDLIINLFGPATKSIGEGLGGVVNYVIGPLRRLNVVSEKSYEDFVKKINSKTDEIPLENRDNSKLGLALKTLEDSRYQLEEEDMREYFANLLSGLVDNRKNQSSSPRFSTILSEFTTDDASILEKLYKYHVVPTITVRAQLTNDDGGLDMVENILLFDDNYSFSSNSVLQTLQSYGLIQIRPSIILTSEKHTKIYDDFENSTDFNNLKKDIEIELQPDPYFQNSSYNVRCKHGSVTITNLGYLFCTMIFSNEE